MRHLPLSPIRTGGKQTRTSDHRLEVDGLSFEVHRSDRRKTLQITVERTGALSIVAPLQAADQQLVEFVEEKLLWVHTKIEEKARLQQRAPIKEFVDGEGFLYLGKSYRLRLVENQLVDLSLRNGRFCLRKASVHRGREILVSWYTRRAQDWFERQVTEQANRIGVSVKEVNVQDLGYRWGSFGSGGRVSFHWKAILLPPRIAQYVVIHELAMGCIPTIRSTSGSKSSSIFPTGDGERVGWQKMGFRSKGCRPYFFSETFRDPSPACFSSTAGGVTAT